MALAGLASLTVQPPQPQGPGYLCILSMGLQDGTTTPCFLKQVLGIKFRSSCLHTKHLTEPSLQLLMSDSLKVCSCPVSLFAK